MAWSLNRDAEQEVGHIVSTLGTESEEDYRRLEPAERYMVDVFWLIAETNNGGLDQYFTNQSGDHAAEVLEALRAIGATQTLAILERACNLFPNGTPSRSWEERNDQMDGMLRVQNLEEGRNPQFDPLDAEFYSRGENLEQLLIDYWKRSGAKVRTRTESEAETLARVADIRWYLSWRIERNGSFQLQEFAAWMAEDEDLRIWGIAYDVLFKAYRRIHPEPGMELTCGFTVRYLLRCVRDNPMDGELHSGYEAAWELATRIKQWATCLPESAPVLEYAATHLRQEYLDGDDAVRKRILNGALEHALESAPVRPFFDDWKVHPDLREPWKLAMEWAVDHTE
ncbi:MAG: DMP19 family protein [Planctomycetaceae bacterium]